MTGDSANNQPALQPASFPGQPQLDLFCPRCAYPLVKVEESGLTQCPECGETLDFGNLRRLRVARLPIDATWALCWTVLYSPARFFERLPSPQYYGTRPLGSESRYWHWSLLAVLGATVCVVTISGLWSMAPSMLIPFMLMAGLCGCVPLVLWITLVAAAQGAAEYWIRWLLSRAGHREPLFGGERVMFYASTVFVPLAIWYSLLLMTSVAAGALRLEFMGRIATFVFPVGYMALWGWWAWIVMLAFQAETRGLDAPSALWAFANPGLVLALLPAGAMALLLLR